jgi:hypothetical protein
MMDIWIIERTTIEESLKIEIYDLLEELKEQWTKNLWKYRYMNYWKNECWRILENRDIWFIGINGRTINEESLKMIDI